MPLLGGPLAVALNELREGRDHRLVDFVLDVDADLHAQGTTLARLLAESIDFASRAESIFELVVQAGHVGKRDYYRRAIVKGAGAKRPADDDSALFMDTLNRVQRPHLRLFAALIKATPSPDSSNMTVLWNHMKAAAPGLSDIILARSWDELGNMGILTTRNIVTDSSPPQVADEDGLITVFGLAFAGFLAMDSPGPKRRARRKSKPRP